MYKIFIKHIKTKKKKRFTIKTAQKFRNAIQNINMHILFANLYILKISIKDAFFGGGGGLKLKHS